MTSFKKVVFVTAALFAAVLMAAPANAQATRTWVSGVGDDANPCSRTAPCKTFAGAISKTAVNGEINCLDPAGYGAVTITKSIALVCDYTEGGITNPSTTGITVNAAGGTVFLNGIDLEGIAAGINGMNIINATAVHINHCKIRGNNNSGSFGIKFAPSVAASLYVTDSIVADNGSGATGGGILVQPTGTGSAVVLVKDTFVLNNANIGLDVDSTGLASGNGSTVTAVGSTFSGSTFGVDAVTPASTAPATIMLTGDTVTNNVTAGVLSNGATSTIRVGGSTITKNGTGVAAINTGVLKSYGDNYVDGNTTNGTFALPNLGKL